MLTDLMIRGCALNTGGLLTMTAQTARRMTSLYPLPFTRHHPRSRPVIAAIIASSLALAALPALAQPSDDPDLPTRIEESLLAGRDLLFGGKNVMWRYGNWLGKGWWGGSELPDRPGMLPPIDDLDRTAQKHDFGYQIAEELGRGRPGVEGTYMMIADIIAVRDTLLLDRDPAKWTHKPKDMEQARTFVKRLIISFQEFQMRYNKFRSMELGRDDLTDLETLDRMLDGLPDVAQFEALQRQRVRNWEKDYAAFQSRKQQAQPKPKTPTPSGPATDCSQGSLLDRSLCSHDPTKNAVPRNQ
mgnify:FL=1